MATPGNPASNLAGDFQVLSQPPATRFITSQVGAPTLQYIETDSRLQIQGWSALANQTLTIAMRYLRAVDGVLVTHKEILALNTDGSSAFLTVNLPEGFLLGINIGTNTTAKTAAAFVTVQLNKYRGGAIIQETFLVSDYVQGNQFIAWPGARITRSREGPGRPTVTFPASPGAGADVNITTGKNEWVALQFLLLQFVAGAAVANRNIALSILQSTTELYRVAIPGNVTAGQVLVISASPGTGAASVNNGVASVPIPPQVVIQSDGIGLYAIKTITANIQPADQFTITAMQTENWLECA